MARNYRKKLISFFLIIGYLLSSLTVTTYAASTIFPYYNEPISSKAAIIMDANSSIILYEHNANTRLYPASLVKIMTAIIVLENANGDYDNIVNFSYNAISQDIDKTSTTIGAVAGDQLSVKDCLYSLLLPSANDVANALAEHVAGSVKDFVLLMNERATTLGCSNTHFVNPSGLHNDDQYTTATDMAKILQYAMTFPMYMQVTSSVSYRHSPIKRFKDPDNSNNQVLNTNSILLPGSIYYYSNITSGKTGHTQLAGYNIASSAKKHGMHLICIILGSQTDKIRYTESKLLYDFYFDNYVSLNIVDIDPRFNNDLSAIAINDVSLIDTLNITCNQDAHITLPVNVDYNSITSKINYQVEDAYDRYAIGTIYYYLGDTFVGKCNIEGKNADTNDSIFTGNLDLSNRQLIDEVSINTKNIDKTSISHNSLVYINNSGDIIASNTLILFIVITIITTIVIALSIFIYTNVISNSNIPIQKVFFKLRRKFRK